MKTIKDYETIEESLIDSNTLNIHTTIQQYINKISHIKGTLLPDLEGLREYYKLNNLSTENVNVEIFKLKNHLRKLEQKKIELENEIQK